MYLRETIKKVRLLHLKTQVKEERASKMVITSCKSLSLAVYLAAAILLLVAVAVSVDCEEQLNVESRQQKENDDLTAEIKYLENLDNIYSQVGRPR